MKVVTNKEFASTLIPGTIGLCIFQVWLVYEVVPALYLAVSLCILSIVWLFRLMIRDERSYRALYAQAGKEVAEMMKDWNPDDWYDEEDADEYHHPDLIDAYEEFERTRKRIDSRFEALLFRDTVLRAGYEKVTPSDG